MTKAKNLLTEYLQSSNAAEAENTLEELLSVHARPVIEQILASKLQSDSRNQPELEDLTSEALLHVLSQLRELKRNSTAGTMESFENYVASIAFNTWNQYLRQAHPRRTGLRNRLRYTLKRHPELDLWKLHSTWFCGYKNWKTKEASVDRNLLSRIEIQQGADLPVQVIAFFDRASSAVPFSLLVDYFCDLHGIRESDASDDQLDQFEHNSPSVELTIERVEELKFLFDEITKMSLNQRRALLLNLRDEHGGSMLPIFSMMGIASIRQLANLLDFPLDRFTSLWNELPISDQTIAEILGATRQQVINLRKCARERLTRRMQTRREYE